MNWNQYFLDIAIEVSKKSKDPHTHVGCVIVGPDHEIRSTGYNSFPMGIIDDVPERLERPEKYAWIEHSERNAIYLAARVGQALKGCMLYCQWVPCADCARAIIQSGIEMVIIDERFRQQWEIKDKWEDSIKRSLQMFAEARVNLAVYDYDLGHILPYSKKEE